jgi:hypothetical protein
MSKRLKVFWALYLFSILCVGVLCAGVVAGVTGDAASAAMSTLGLIFTTFCGVAATYIGGESFRPSGHDKAAHVKPDDAS